MCAGNKQCPAKHHHRGRFLPRGFLRASLLLILSKGEGYGYTLQQDLIGCGLMDEPDMGSIYRNLRALEEDGMIRSDWHSSEKGPEKRVYIITDAGLELLKEWGSMMEFRKKKIAIFMSLLDDTLKGAGDGEENS